MEKTHRKGCQHRQGWQQGRSIAPRAYSPRPAGVWCARAWSRGSAKDVPSFRRGRISGRVCVQTERYRLQAQISGGWSSEWAKLIIDNSNCTRHPNAQISTFSSHGPWRMISGARRVGAVISSLVQNCDGCAMECRTSTLRTNKIQPPLTAAEIRNQVSAAHSIREGRKWEWLRDGHPNWTFPALLRRVASRRVPIDECFNIGLCERACIEHYIVVLKICMHNFIVVHMCQTPQGMQKNMFSQWQWKTSLPSGLDLEALHVSSQKGCNEA